MTVDISPGMPLENVNRAVFRSDIRRPNPQKQPAALQLIL